MRTKQKKPKSLFVQSEILTARNLKKSGAAFRSLFEEDGSKFITKGKMRRDTLVAIIVLLNIPFLALLCTFADHCSARQVPDQPYALVVTKITPEILSRCRKDANCMDLTEINDQTPCGQDSGLEAHLER